MFVTAGIGGEQGEKSSRVDGARYDPAADAWRPVPDMPDLAVGARGAWTGSELVVLGTGLSHQNFHDFRTV
jgi:hypothetical protein